MPEVLGQRRHLVGRDDEGDGRRAVGVLVAQEGLDLAGHVRRVVGAELEDAGHAEAHGGGLGHEDLGGLVVGGDERHLPDADLATQPQDGLQFWEGQLTAKKEQSLRSSPLENAWETSHIRLIRNMYGGLVREKDQVGEVMLYWT